MALPETRINGMQEQEQSSQDAGMLQQKMDDLINDTNQFTYIITHDLQAPLRMITGFLELIEKRYAAQLDDTGKQYIDYAMKGSAKMKSLIFDLLEYSRLSSVEQVFAATDLNEILDNVKKDLETETSNSGALISAGTLPVIRADKRLMTLLFRHIMENALKFRSTSVPEIKIWAVQSGGNWELSFRDNGIGIDPAFLEKIFIIFRRLHSDEVRYPGSGTGLAICRKIAGLHKGEIKAASAPGEGTVITVRLPV